MPSTASAMFRFFPAGEVLAIGEETPGAQHRPAEPGRLPDRTAATPHPGSSPIPWRAKPSSGSSLPTSTRHRSASSIAARSASLAVAPGCRFSIFQPGQKAPRTQSAGQFCATFLSAGADEMNTLPARRVGSLEGVVRTIGHLLSPPARKRGSPPGLGLVLRRPRIRRQRQPHAGSARVRCAPSTGLWI